MTEPVTIAITDETGALRPLEAIELDVIREALRRHGRLRAAAALQIGRSTLYRKIKKLEPAA